MGSVDPPTQQAESKYHSGYEASVGLVANGAIAVSTSKNNTHKKGV